MLPSPTTAGPVAILYSRCLTYENIIVFLGQLGQMKVGVVHEDEDEKCPNT